MPKKTRPVKGGASAATAWRDGASRELAVREAHARARVPQLDARSQPRQVVTRLDGRQQRRMTIYLPPALAKRLAIYCASEELSLSYVVAGAVDDFFQEEDRGIR